MAYFLITMVLVGLFGCNYQDDKQIDNTQLPANHSALSFATVKEVVLDRCIVCHDGSKSWNCSDYGVVKGRLDKIQNRVLEKRDMPPGPPLTTTQYEVLSKWISSGAPEFGEEKPSSPPSKPLEPKFASIYEKILLPMCVHCHSPEKPGFKVPLNTRADLLNSPRLLVLPGNPDESGLYLSVKRKDKKRMPPPESPVRPLTPDEISTVYEWIKSGAPE